jgi:uncharacterized protein
MMKKIKLVNVASSVLSIALFAAITVAVSASVQAQTAASAPAQQAAEFDVRENYTKYEYRIPMRDGVRLFTSVYVPKDQSKTYPFLMQRTPYSAAPYGVNEYPRRLGPTPELLRLGYIFVTQDVRGRYMSEGKWIEMTPHKPNKGAKDIDESTDMYDTVEWLLKNITGNNGRVGIWGNSYPGFYVSASIVDSHPAIKAASPQAPVTDLYFGDDTYHNGAFMLAANFGFYTSFKPQENPTSERTRWDQFKWGTRDGYEFYLKAGTLADIIKMGAKDGRTYFTDQAKNDTYNTYWQERSIWKHFKNIKTNVLTVGGWYDAEDPQGPLTTYREIKKHNTGIHNALVMGPWSHGGWLRNDGRRMGHVDFGANTADYYRKNILVPFFERHLKGAGKEGSSAKDTSASNPPEAYVFETGTNVWRQFPAWPPQQAKPATMFLQANGKLAWTQPAASVAAASTSFDEYVSDPAKPVPYTNATTISVPQEYMVGDQRFVATRPDVLVYQSDVLETDVTIAGPISPTLFVSTSGTDSDFVVKLIDVYPAEMESDESPPAAATPPRDVQVPRHIMSGYQRLIRGEPFRAKFRESFITPKAMVPNQVEKITFAMPDVMHTFRRGHRIMVQIQSSWFPLIDRNPQTFVRIPEAKASDYVKATQRVFRAGNQASRIEVLVMPQPQ